MKKIQVNKKAVFLPQWMSCKRETTKLQYIEEKIDLVDETIQQLKNLSGNADVVCLLKI